MMQQAMRSKKIPRRSSAISASPAPGQSNKFRERSMQRSKPPFRADEVGSLLRPPRIKEARARLEKGEVAPEELRKIEDMEVEKVVHKQASIGLRLATDGEFRRSWWHFDFLAKLTGCELFHPDVGIQFAGVET